jgi:tetratricopeptide (TPR) repeat protein/tRNA A-37 threonylcarbamoyl transferase component Bud32
MDREIETFILKCATETGLINTVQLGELEQEVSEGGESDSGRWSARIRLLIQKGWVDEAAIERLQEEGQHDSASGQEESPAATRMLPTEDAGITLKQKSPVPPKAQPPGRTDVYIPAFPPGYLVANRYRVVRFIAQGGMGEVYEVEDLELQEHVALKTVRSEVMRDGQTIARFRREVNLARKVSHPNVCRTFDIGRHQVRTGNEDPKDEVTFLTMELLAGETLEERVRRVGRMSLEEALPIISQMAEGLNAAHKAGVVHRDFKSRNVMLVPAEGQGVRAVITDFGIARGNAADDHLSTAVTGLGEIVGTPAYMAPEQIEGAQITPAVDVYAFGVVIYEMVTGECPFSGSTLPSLVRRLKELPPSPRIHVSDLDPNWEQAILRCLERDPADRFASASDVVKALTGEQPQAMRETRAVRQGPAVETQRQRVGAEDYQTRKMGADTLGPGVVEGQDSSEEAYQTRKISADTSAIEGARRGALPERRLADVERKRKWGKPVMAAAAVLLLLVVGLLLKGNLFRPSAPQRAVSLLVADFNNTTADPVFDGTIEQALGDALEGASFFNSFIRDEARKIAGQIQAGAARLDEPLARLVAARAGVNVVVAGDIARRGGGYKASVRAVDAVTGKQIVSSAVEVANKEGVLATVGKLAATIRKALGDNTPESAQLAAAETYTAASLEAAHSYAVAQELQWAGRLNEAVSAYARTIQLDPNLGRAYAGLAAIYANLGQREQAEKNYQLALARIGRMTERERYRTRGGYYLLVRNHEKAIEEFSSLLKQYPSDSGGLTNLPLAYFYRRDFARALGEGRRAIEAYPKDIIKRNNVALYAMYAGDFDTAVAEANKVLELNPSFGKAYVALALSKLAQGQPSQAAELYQRLAGVSAWGASMAANGMADLALYEGRLSDAATVLEKGIEADRSNQNNDGTCYKLALLAYTNLLRGRAREAVTAADQAVAGTKNEGVLFVAARVYLGAGQEKRALALASDLSPRIEPEPQVYAKLIEGEALMARGKAREAIGLFQDAQKLADTWLGRFYLGRAYLDFGAFTEASSEFDACLKRRSEATAVFLDDAPSYYYLPPVYYFLGRAQEGLHSQGAIDSYLTFLRIKERGGEDPLVPDARRRIAGR